MTDWTTHRTGERYLVEVLTRTEATRFALDGVVGGQVEWSVDTDLRTSGRVDVDEIGQQVDWLSDRIRITYLWDDGARTLGVFLPSAPTRQWSQTGSTWSVDLLGKLTILAEQEVEQTYALPAGTVVTDAVRTLIASTGEAAISVTSSPLTLALGRQWDPGTTLLRIVNDLLDTIGYYSLTTSDDGAFVAAPYVPPAQRPVAWRFEAGPSAIHSPTWSRAQDVASVPNRIIMTSTGSADQAAWASSATNTDPASPYSTVSRGRVISRTITGQEAASWAVLDTLCARALTAATAAVATISATHAPLPLRPNDRVQWVQDTAVDAVLRSATWNLQVGAAVQAKFREVVA